MVVRMVFLVVFVFASLQEHAGPIGGKQGIGLAANPPLHLELRPHALLGTQGIGLVANPPLVVLV